jgi:hypothetical protein
MAGRIAADACYPKRRHQEFLAFLKHARSLACTTRAPATGDAMGNDQQGLFYGHSRGTAWYAGVRYRYGSS